MEDQGQSRSVSAPPPPEMTIRTMKSDLASLKASGGTETVPQIFRPHLSAEPERTKDAEKQNDEAQQAPPAFPSGEESFFERKSSLEAITESSGGSNVSKIIFIVMTAIVLVALFWVLGYYVVFPWLFPPQMPPVQ
ncbi:hypothetical protein HY504_00230 [Candidatus Wolfebacteria bacterium]|nr:hypothetical protein [Candidatus Wolfebacteria bacterium]